MRKVFELFYEGYMPDDIVRELDFCEIDVQDLAVKVNTWLEELQREARYQDNFKIFFDKN